MIDNRIESDGDRTPREDGKAATEQSLEPHAVGRRTVFGRLAQLCCTAVMLVVVFGLPMWWLHTVSGPYLWVARLEMRMFGSYGSNLFFVPVFMAWLLIWFVLSLTAQWWPGPLRHLPAAFDATAAFWLGPLLVVVAGVGLCLYGFIPRDPQQISINEIYSADVRPPRYVSLTDVQIDPVLPVLEVKSDNIERSFVPVVGIDGGGQPLKVFVETISPERVVEGIVAEQTVTGLVERSGLPGLHREWFEQQGLDVADEQFVIDEGSDPTMDGIIGIIAIVVGVVLGFPSRSGKQKVAGK